MNEKDSYEDSIYTLLYLSYIQYIYLSAKIKTVLLPLWTAVGVALSYGWFWFCGWRNSGDAAVVGTQQQAETHKQSQRQQQVVLPV